MGVSLRVRGPVGGISLDGDFLVGDGFELLVDARFRDKDGRYTEHALEEFGEEDKAEESRG